MKYGNTIDRPLCDPFAMKKKRHLFLTGFLLGILGASCSTESQIKHYSGDGKIEASPRYGLWSGGGGYIVQFTPIKLDSQKRVTYRFSGLPNLRSRLYLAVGDPRLWRSRNEIESDRTNGRFSDTNNSAIACRDDVTGVCEISLKDGGGKVILHFKKKLSDLTWSRAGEGPWELYDLNAISFVPHNKEYVLDVNIDPVPLLKDDSCYVLIRGSGREPVSIGL